MHNPLFITYACCILIPCFCLHAIITSCACICCILLLYFLACMVIPTFFNVLMKLLYMRIQEL